MLLSKVSAGHLKGPKGKTANLKLAPRDAGVTSKILSVVYGEEQLDHDGSTCQLKIAKGEQPLTVVYAATDTSFVELLEMDGAGSQKLKADKFNPREPFLSIWMEGV